MMYTSLRREQVIAGDSQAAYVLGYVEESQLQIGIKKVYLLMTSKKTISAWAAFISSQYFTFCH